MGYSPSPRPVFDGPAHIPYETAARHLWGDPEAGEVADWIYVSSAKIHQLVFGLLPGRMFGHSREYRTVFGADEVLYVLSGVMVIINPETGEVQRAEKGESVFFRRDTWHHAFNYSTEPLRVLELLAPPPSKGTTGSYARTRPYLVSSLYTQNQWLGRWPMERAEARADDSFVVMRNADLLWRMEGHEHHVLVGLIASTEHLTVGTIELLPGQQSDRRCHGGDLSLYVVEGTLNVRVPENEGQRWFELKAGDGFYVPEGVSYQYYNISGATAKLIFGVAPQYLAAS